MSVKTVSKVHRQNPEITEDELQKTNKTSKNKTVRAMLAARREFLRKSGRFLTDTEINRELKRK